MILDKTKECINPLSPHMHVFIVPSGLQEKSIEHAKNSSFFDKMIAVSANGLVCDKAKEFVDFINGVCLSMCIISNANSDSVGGINYPSKHSVLGEMQPYYDFIERNIQKDFSLISECSELLCFMVLPEDDFTDTVH